MIKAFLVGGAIGAVFTFTVATLVFVCRSLP
jgi:hypothetical protein